MNEELALLQGLGLEMPSPAYLIGSLVFSLIGWVAFRRGRKSARHALAWGGVALMFLPVPCLANWLLWGWASPCAGGWS